MGINFRKLGDFDSSIHELKMSIDLIGDKASAYNNLGLSYFEKQDMDLAIQAFNKAIKLEKQAVHYNNLALAHFHNKQLYDALDNFSTALELN